MGIRSCGPCATQPAGGSSLNSHGDRRRAAAGKAAPPADPLHEQKAPQPHPWPHASRAPQGAPPRSQPPPRPATGLRRARPNSTTAAQFRRWVPPPDRTAHQAQRHVGQAHIPPLSLFSTMGTLYMGLAVAGRRPRESPDGSHGHRHQQLVSAPASLHDAEPLAHGPRGSPRAQERLRFIFLQVLPSHKKQPFRTPPHSIPPTPTGRDKNKPQPPP